ncbi:hypothetical protein A0H81_06652 [Grifola frondosa]|uniref:Uncharacterized protein n=1 Tax=Grifola frondosa TaxID=5627 RepID=A0A1C7MDP6_GRIFR|nr:hypothetical protein A0H81_06652 [Grifola frondosa]
MCSLHVCVNQSHNFGGTDSRRILGQLLRVLGGSLTSLTLPLIDCDDLDNSITLKHNFNLRSLRVEIVGSIHGDAAYWPSLTAHVERYVNGAGEAWLLSNDGDKPLPRGHAFVHHEVILNGIIIIRRLWAVNQSTLARYLALDTDFLNKPSFVSINAVVCSVLLVYRTHFILHYDESLDVYAEQLFHFGHGLPLWFPEPGDSGEISIGDVGYIEKGRFYGLFNTMLPDDHKVNKRYGVPEPFECFEVPHNFKRSCPDAVKQDELRSESITPVDVSVGATAQTIVSAGLQFRYKCSNEHGALLRLSQPGHAVAIHCGQSIKDYMRLQHSHWFTFARDVMGLEKQEEDLIFVSGHVKTAEWLLIAEYTSSSREGELSFTGTVGPSASANASLSMSHSVSMSVQYRPGPPKALSICPDSSISVAANNSAGDDTPASASEKSNFDQCIFLNYYKLKTRRFRAPKIIEAAAGTHEQPRSDDDNDKDSPASISSSDDSFEEVPVCNKMYDPVNYLLDYILGHSEASMAIASDSDFISICKDEDIPIDIPAMLERIAPEIEIDKHGVGTISSNIGSGLLDANLLETIVSYKLALGHSYPQRCIAASHGLLNRYLN